MRRALSPALLGGCQICHIDVVDKLRGAKHAKKGVGCRTCHGPSNAHMEDENNEVKPDRLLKPHDVDDWCSGCHLEFCPNSQLRKRHAPPKTCATCHDAHAARIPPKRP